MRNKLLLTVFLFVAGLWVFTGTSGQDLTLSPSQDASISYKFPDSTLTLPNGKNLFSYSWEEDTAIAFVQFDVSEYSGLQVDDFEFSVRASTNLGSDDYNLDLYGVGAATYNKISPYEDASVSSKFADSTLTLPNGKNLFAYEWEEDKAIAYMKFDLSQFKGSTITGADLSLRASQDMSSDDYNLALFGTYSGWTDDNLTWNTRPSILPDTLGTRVFTSESARASFDNKGQSLVDYLNAKIMNGETMVSLAIVSFGAGDTARGHQDYYPDHGTWIGSEEDGSWGPYLSITTEGVGVDEVTWSSHPQVLNSKLASRVLTGESARLAFTSEGTALIDYVNAKLMDGADAITFAIKSSGVGDTARGHQDYYPDHGMWIGSTEDGSWGPYASFSWASSLPKVSPGSDASISSMFPDSTLTLPNGKNLFAYEWEQDTAIAFVQFDIGQYSGLQVDDFEFSVRASSNLGSDDYNLDLFGVGAATYGDISPYEDASVSSKFADSTLTLPNGKNLFAYEWEEDKAIAYMKFDLSQFKGSKITGADLSLRASQAMGSDDYNLALFGTYSAWTDDNLTWNTRPAILPDTLGTRVFTSESARASFDNKGQSLVDYLNAKIMNGETMVSLAIVSFGAGDTARGHQDYYPDHGTWIGSEEDGSWGPYLSVTAKGAGVNSVTWNSHPEVLNTKLASRTLTSESGRMTFTPGGTQLVDYVNSQLLSGAEKLTFAIKSSGAGDTARGHQDYYPDHGMWIGSTEDGSWGPYAEFTWAQEIKNIGPSMDASITQMFPDSTLTLPNGKNLFAYAWEQDTAYAFMQFDVSQYKGLTVKDVQVSTRASSNMGSEDYNLDLYGAGPSNFGDISPYEDASVSSKFTDSTLTLPNGKNLFAYEWEEDKAIAYMKFDLSQFEGATITSADLSLRASQNMGADDYNLALFGTYSSWTDDNLTWNTRPAILPDTLGTRVFTSESARASFSNKGQSLIDYLNSKLENGETMVSLAIVSFGAGDTARGHQDYYPDHGTWIGSTEDGSWGPYLSINAKGAGVGNVTWNSHPEILDTKLATRLLTDESTRTAFTSDGTKLIDYVNNQLKQGAETITLVIKSSGVGDTARGHQNYYPDHGMWIGSEEDGSWGPYMSLTLFDFEVLAPGFSPVDGEYVSSVEVSLSTVHGSRDTVYYTLDETAPDNTSDVWTGNLTFTENTTLKAVTYRYDAENVVTSISDTITKVYTVLPQVETPAISPDGGAILTSDEITITTATDGATIYYTVDGTDPDNTSTEYTAPITLDPGAVEVRAIAYKDGMEPSEVVISAFNVTYPQVATPVVSPAGGNISDNTPVSITTATSGATIYYTTDGSQPDDNATEYTGEFTLSQEGVVFVKAIAYADEMTPSDVVTVTLTVVVGIEDEFVDGIGIYPNPAKEFLTLSMDNDVIGEITIAIYDRSSRLVKNITIEKSQQLLNHKIDISNIESGIYFISVKNNEYQSVQKFVIK